MDAYIQQKMELSCNLLGICICWFVLREASGQTHFVFDFVWNTDIYD